MKASIAITIIPKATKPMATSAPPILPSIIAQRSMHKQKAAKLRANWINEILLFIIIKS